MSFFGSIEYKDSGNIDAFGRLRVSQLTTQLDLKQLHDKQPLLLDEQLIGTATALHDTTEAATTLSAPANSDAAILQTFQRYHYQSGKSQLLFWTFNNIGDSNNLALRVFKGGTSQVNVTRTNWDDPLDGTGDSGITHDFDNNTILACDYEWLGVGRIRWYVIKMGVFVQFHEEEFTDSVGVYMSSPNQPMRWELRNSGGTYTARVGYFSSNTTTPFASDLDGIFLENTDANNSLDVICSSVNSEGSINQIGKILSVNAGTNDLQFNNIGTTYAGVGIRLKDTHLDQVIDIIGFDYLAETNDRALWELRLNPTVTGTFAYSDVTNSGVQTAVGNQTAGAAPTVTGGTILDSGYVQQLGDVRADIQSSIKLGASIDGTRDEIVLCVTPISAGLDAYVSYTWREL